MNSSLRAATTAGPRTFRQSVRVGRRAAAGLIWPRAAGLGLCLVLGLGCSETGDDGRTDNAASGSGGVTSTGGGQPTSGLGGAGTPGASGSPPTSGTMGGVDQGGSAGTAAQGGSASMAGTGGASTSGGSSAGGGAGGGGNNGVAKSAGCGKPRTLMNGDTTVSSGGASRNYKLRAPDDYDPDRPYRLILSFHGATDNSGKVAPSYFGLFPLAEGSTIFIAPDAVGGIWNNTADVTFVDDILKQVEAGLCIDTKRIHLEGFSQGGAMAWTLACARPGVFGAAVVHSGGGLARPASCSPIAFMSSLGQGESDKGQTSNSDFFATQNGCTIKSLPKAPSGGHACSDYEGCSAGHPTRWCDYDGGHTPSPSDQGQSPSWMPQEVWTFLKQF